MTNGLPLRRDVHRLFDLGYITVRPDLRVAVCSELRRDPGPPSAYASLEGRPVKVPDNAVAHPCPDALA